jgi:squalene-hopene/tetraprenyl-beta-curcumene cyclase
VTDALLQRLRAAHNAQVGRLLGEIGPEGHWLGELSSSALSTATAVTALSAMDAGRHREPIRRGLEWLARNGNPDGGWGDTIRSRSNPSTTSLVWAAFGAANADSRFPEGTARAVAYLEGFAGSLQRLVPAIEELYGSDRTFSVPITMTLALSGRLGPDGWQRVRPLPFELAVVPRGFYGALRLPVVSYALPALIAIGQVIHHRSGRFNPLRNLARNQTLAVLDSLQPTNGGFLEATPLTSFVTMSLAGMDRQDHPVARRGTEFLCNSIRPDGSWPIDTNLATWVTTLSIKALGPTLNPAQRQTLLRWLLGQQYQATHPYTGAAPGGWAWTDLPGGVPDADDTAGALLALHQLDPASPETIAAAAAGCTWLFDIQNRDGGIPTFCRGWGTLPFDRSTPELTAHALRAWHAWAPSLSGGFQGRIRHAFERALLYLTREQARDGSWSPLWFGNEYAPQQENPVYGTAQVLMGLRDISPPGSQPSQVQARAIRFLEQVQSPEGGWGGNAGVPPSIEETALALSALTGFAPAQNAVERGATWLLDQLDVSPQPKPTPIGLYFARLWYFERLYPQVFTVDALRRLTA